jgi:uncharacterized protein
LVGSLAICDRIVLFFSAVEVRGMRTGSLLIDADGHILEPHDLWERYLEARYRDHPVRIRTGSDGLEFLEVDGKPAKLTSAALLHSLGGMSKLREIGAGVEQVNAKKRQTLEGRTTDRSSGARPFGSFVISGHTAANTYLSGCAPGAMDLKEQLEILERENMAKAIIYPTLGLLWEAEVFDPEITSAYCRAYNRWITFSAAMSPNATGYRD